MPDDHDEDRPWPWWRAATRFAHAAIAYAGAVALAALVIVALGFAAWIAHQAERNCQAINETRAEVRALAAYSDSPAVREHATDLIDKPC